MTCQDEILDCFQSNAIIKEVFTIKDTKFAESTIKTHITSRMCGNSPDNHNTTYDDFIRTDDGYMLKCNKTQKTIS